MDTRMTWHEPGPPKRTRPIIEQLVVLHDHPNRWAQIATYDSRGSATAVMSRLRHRMGTDPSLDLRTRLLDDGRVGLFARWTVEVDGVGR